MNDAERDLFITASACAELLSSLVDAAMLDRQADWSSFVDCYNAVKAHRRAKQDARDRIRACEVS